MWILLRLVGLETICVLLRDLFLGVRIVYHVCRGEGEGDNLRLVATALGGRVWDRESSWVRSEYIIFPVLLLVFVFIPVVRVTLFIRIKNVLNV